MADVLVIVVTWNAMRWAEKCLGSIAASAVPADAVVIDNGSTDGTCDFIRSRYPGTRLVETGENLGFGAANNIGFRMALEQGYSYVYLLNQDAWLEPDTLGTLISAAETDESGIFSPMQMNADGRQDSRFRKKTERYLRRSGDVCVRVPFVMAAHWLITRRALETVGGFSPAFRQYGEDDNYLDRLHYHGMECSVVASAFAVHDRASRKPDKAARMRLKCVAPVVKVSNPCAPLFWMLVREPLELIGMAVRNLSATPLLNIPALLRRYPELIRLRRESKQRGAFL